MVTSLMNICDETNVYGFWPFSETSNGTFVPYHYYEFAHLTNFGYVHDTDDEFNILWRLHELNLIKLHIDPCL